MNRKSSRSYFASFERPLGRGTLAEMAAWSPSKFAKLSWHLFVALSYLFLGSQAAWAQGATGFDAPAPTAKAAPLTPVMPVEERLPYLRKLKAFLEEDPLDMAEFERQFDLKLECKPWRTTGKICEYHTKESRWPYVDFNIQSRAVSYFLRGNGTEDLLWISLMYPDDRRAYNCITGSMVRQVFIPPEWTAVVDKAVSHEPSPHPSEVLLLALHGHDRLQRRLSIVTTGVTSCTGTLQITVHTEPPSPK